MTTSLRSLRFCMTSLSSPISTSVDTVRSCASSSTMTLYAESSGSSMASRSSMPSVRYLSCVLALVKFSKRMVYPTSLPYSTSISSATRFDTDMAATRRGCVHATNLPPAV